MPCPLDLGIGDTQIHKGDERNNYYERATDGIILRRLRILALLSPFEADQTIAQCLILFVLGRFNQADRGIRSQRDVDREDAVAADRSGLGDSRPWRQSPSVSIPLRSNHHSPVIMSAAGKCRRASPAVTQ